MFRKWIQYWTIKRSGLFDPRYYFDANPDCRRADVDPLLHFIEFGWKEGRNPSSLFSVNDYLDMYKDVQTAGVNPLIHYIKFGRMEGRLCKKPLPPPSITEDSFHPKVTVVVPNYNHSRFLEQRLSSIYSQTYRNFNVILLDDCSTDTSREILEQYQWQYREITSTLFNDSNSGNVFSQWKKGMGLADGELIWIAESDDYCDENFLEKLVPYFKNESVMLSYAHSVFVDENGEKHGFTFENYLGDVSRDKWSSSYIETAHNEVCSSLGLRNSIPNISSVVFRRPGEELGILNDTEWLNMKICGDWIFYLHLIRGGSIAYSVDTNNYFRIHQSSSSKKTHDQDTYYQEHEAVACTIARLYAVPVEVLQRNHQIIKDFYFQVVKDGSLDEFVKLYDIEKVMESRKNRPPNILMAIYAFWFGGGEILPIRLANALKEKGVGVTVFDPGFLPVNPIVRKMLSPMVPVISFTQSLDIHKIIKDYGIEIVHTHHAYVDGYFAWVRLQDPLNTRHVVTMHGMYEMLEEMTVFEEKAKDAINTVDHWFYIAEKNIAPFKSHGVYVSDKFQKIENGMKQPAIHPVDLAEIGIEKDAFTICLASRALPEKGWLESVAAIDIARRETDKNIHLLLIGEGPVYDSLQKETLPGYIHLLGYKPNVVDYLAASHVGLIASYFGGESFPLVIIESFMAGKPVLASDIGEARNMISLDDGTTAGILIPLRDGKIHPDDIASALIRIVNDSGYYQKCAQAADLAKGRYEIGRIADEYIKSYASLAAK
jgi:glycosyltransferase involved in cell wall biosynthesis